MQITELRRRIIVYAILVFLFNSFVASAPGCEERQSNNGVAVLEDFAVPEDVVVFPVDIDGVALTVVDGAVREGSVLAVDELGPHDAAFIDLSVVDGHVGTVSG